MAPAASETVPPLSQTVFPPSTHPSGELISWTSDGEPTGVRGEELERRAHELGAACLLARSWPAPGSRQDAAMALAGGLLRAGRESEFVEMFVRSVALAGEDEEVEKRVAVVHRTAARIRAGEEATGWPKLTEIMPERVIDRAKQWLAIGSDDCPEEDQQADEGGWTEKLVSLASGKGIELFHTPDGIDSEPYAQVPIGDHFETWPVRSRGFRQWLLRRCHEIYSKVPSKTAQEPAIETIAAKARFDGPAVPVAVRVTELAGNVYLDLTNDAWQVVEIRSAGGPSEWRVLESNEAPVRFRRMAGMRSLPTPSRGGSIEELRPLINVSDEDWMLVRGFLLMLFNPWGDYPVLVLDGEHGSAKSTTSEILRRIVDPNKAPVRGLPKNEHDLVLAARNAWVVGIDNISQLPAWLSDALCRLSTGSGIGMRTFFQQEEETIFQVKRPVIVNGINNVATRDDLASRTIPLSLPRIPGDRVRSKEDVLKEFEQAHARILGALLDAALVALARRGKVSLPWKPRLADFCLWVVAGEQALGLPAGEFMRVYRNRIESMTEDVIAASPIGPRLLQLLDSKGSFEGTATKLLKSLEALPGETDTLGKDWPKTGHKVGHLLRHLAPALRAMGFQVELAKRGANPRTHRIWKEDGRSLDQERGKRGNAEGSPDGAENGGPLPRSGNSETRGERGSSRAESPPRRPQNGDSRVPAFSAFSPEPSATPTNGVGSDLFLARVLDAFPGAVDDAARFSRVAPIKSSQPRCAACGSRRRWRLWSGGPWICERCHPPGAPPEQIEWREAASA